MINVNLHPEGRKAGRKSRSGSSFELPSLEGFGGLDSLREDPWRTGLIAAVVLVPLAVGAMWISQRSEAGQLEDRLETALADSTRLADLRALSDSLRDRQVEIRERISLIETLDGGRFVWPHLLNEISDALPTSAWISSIQRQSSDPQLTLEIQAVATTPMTITEFVRALDASRHIGSVRIVRSQRETTDGRPGHAFTLIVRYAEPSEPAETAPLIAGGT